MIVSASCDFDFGLCYGWKQSDSDVFDWTLKKGPTGSSSTGPDYDHTTGSGKRNMHHPLHLIVAVRLF